MNTAGLALPGELVDVGLQGYGLDYICTMDEGKGTRGRSILDAQHRAWLAREYGARIGSPEELLGLLPK